MRIWLWEYAYLVMLGHGRDESAPTPDGMFATHFVGELNPFAVCFVGVSWCVRPHSPCVRCIINNPSAMFWQTVSSRRGRFIVPAYTKTHT